MTEQDKSQETAATLEPAIIQNFHSDRLDIEVKTLPKCRVSLQIKAKPELLKHAKQDAIKQVSKEVSIPGFRKGKAPANLIEAKYPGAINKAWDQSFADAAFKEGQTLAKIPLLNGNARVSYQVTSLNDDAGEITFQFEREPLTPQIDYASFTLLEGAPNSVTEENVSNTIRGIQMFYARWNQVSDRAVKDDDFVVLDIDEKIKTPLFKRFHMQDLKCVKGKWLTGCVKQF